MRRPAKQTSAPQFTVLKMESAFVGRASLPCTPRLETQGAQPGHILPHRRSPLQHGPSSPQLSPARELPEQLPPACLMHRRSHATGFLLPSRQDTARMHMKARNLGQTSRQTQAQLSKKILVTETRSTVGGSQLPRCGEARLPLALQELSQTQRRALLAAAVHAVQHY